MWKGLVPYHRTENRERPVVFKVDHTGFCAFSKLFTQTFLIGRGDVTFLHVTYTKPSQNVEKLTCVHGRFKSPFFLWLIQILKAVTMIMVTAITFFWSNMANPAISPLHQAQDTVSQLRLGLGSSPGGRSITSAGPVALQLPWGEGHRMLQNQGG